MHRHTSCLSLLGENDRLWRQLSLRTVRVGPRPERGEKFGNYPYFCNGFERGSVGLESTEYLHFMAVFAGFQVGGLRSTSCSDRGLLRAVFPTRLRGLRTRGSAVSRVCWGPEQNAWGLLPGRMGFGPCAGGNAAPSDGVGGAEDRIVDPHGVAQVGHVVAVEGVARVAEGQHVAVANLVDLKGGIEEAAPPGGGAVTGCSGLSGLGTLPTG